MFLERLTDSLKNHRMILGRTVSGGFTKFILEDLLNDPQAFLFFVFVIVGDPV